MTLFFKNLSVNNSLVEFLIKEIASSNPIFFLSNPLFTIKTNSSIFASFAIIFKASGSDTSINVKQF